MTLTSEIEEISACPFCGTNDQFVERFDYSSCYVQCDGPAGDGCSCLCRGPIGVQDSDDEEMPGQAAAIRAWNARAQSRRAVGVEELEALRTAIRAQAGVKDHHQEWDETECLLSALIERAGGGV